MYTSGSTGQPKGVMAPHRAIGRLALNNPASRFPTDPTGRLRFQPGLRRQHDGGVGDAHQRRLRRRRRPGDFVDQRFKRWLQDHAISVLWLTAGLFHQYGDALAQPFARLRIPSPAAMSWIRGLRRGSGAESPQRLLNGYGPTETTTFAATCQYREVAASVMNIPIGRPNTPMPS